MLALLSAPVAPVPASRSLQGRSLKWDLDGQNLYVAVAVSLKVHMLLPVLVASDFAEQCAAVLKAVKRP